MTVVVLALLHVLILWRLEFFLYPELLIYPYLTSIGLVPYSQILDQHFPGLMFFPINFYSLGFTDPVSFKVLLLLVVILQIFLIFRLTKSYLSVLLFSLWQPLFEGNQLWLDTFLPLFLLPAYYFFQLGNLALVGLLLGVGVVFKQTLVPVVAYVGLVLLYRKKFKNLIIFSIAAIIPSILMLLYLFSIGVLSDFWYWTINFNLTTFAAHGRNLPTPKETLKLIFIGAVALYCFVRYPKTRHAIFIGALASLETISRFGLIHLQTFIPFLAVAAAYLKYSKKALFLVVIVSAAWLIYFLVRQPNLGQYKYFDQETLHLIKKVQEKTDPGDTIFLLGVQPHIYEQTQTVPPNREFVFQFPWFLQISGGRLLSNLKSDPPKLVLYNPESEIDEQHLKDYAFYLVEYVKTNYQPSDSVGSIQIYARRD